jgi:hypothetical protein
MSEEEIRDHSALAEMIEASITKASVQRKHARALHEMHLAQVADLLSGTTQHVSDALYITAIEHGIPAGITLEWIRDFLVTFTSFQNWKKTEVSHAKD